MTLKARVLVVEDDPLIATCIDELLADLGFEVTAVAASATAALAAVGSCTPTIAIVDIRLVGDIDGIELARLLRAKFAVPAIFLTGLMDDDILQRAAIADPLGFLRKPVRQAQLFDAIDRALKMQSALASI